MSKSLNFDESNYEIKECVIGDRTLIYRSYEGIEYCTNPVDSIQKLNLFVPEYYYHEEKAGKYNLHSAPIFIPNSVGGYMAGPCEWPGENRNGQPNTLFEALEHGYVVASIGVRGRNTENRKGKAPALIVDMKAGIRYLKKNKDRIPGNAERIVTNGTSAGGALSALAGATGNHPDYEPYLKIIGAANADDSVFAANCYCPIHNLENSDMAYEWQFYGCRTYHGMKIEKTAEGMKFTPVSGELSDEQMTLSEELKAEFPAYVNSLNLFNEDGSILTLLQDGTGSFEQLVSDYIKKSAQKELDCPSMSEHDVKTHPAITIDHNLVTKVDFKTYVKTITRMKPVPAFDSLNLQSPENEVFGTQDVDAQYFTEFSKKCGKAGGAKTEEKMIRMLNPVLYIGDELADTAKYWRIRHGSYDRDTSLAIPIILAMVLKKYGKQVDVFLPWGIPHRGDYDLEELFAWIDSICQEVDNE